MDQMILEQQMLDRGAERYLKEQAKALKRHELTQAQNRLFKEAVGLVSKAIEEAVEKADSQSGRKPLWFDSVQSLGSLKCSVLALRVAFGLVSSGDTTLVMVCLQIGKHIEVEMIAKAVEEGCEETYKKLTKRVKNLPGQDFKGKVFTELATEAGFWNPLPRDEQVKIGAGLLNFILSATGLFVTYLDNEGTEEQTLGIAFTKEANDRIKEIEGIEVWMKPVFRPMVTPPRDWSNAFTGCYQDPRLSNTFKIIKTDNKEHLKLVDQAVKANAQFVQALNAIQAVPLRINTFILDCVEKAYAMGIEVESFPSRENIVIPKDAPRWQKRQLKRRQTEIKSEQANFRRDIAEAKEYAEYGTFWLPGQLDWRGRVYAKPHLNHQREDHCKALFEFAEGKKMTPDAAIWLAIHLATVGAFEKADKAPLSDRYEWTRGNTSRILQAAQEPFKDLWWASADSPFVFLAACRAWADYQEQGYDYVCHLPIAVDGSCSGLQHFSAMLRDPIGAEAVNLRPLDVPSDVYGAVAAVCKEKAEADKDNPLAQIWLNYGITRKVAKRCVMTYVYGSRQYGFAEHLYEDFMQEFTNQVISGRLNKHPFGEDNGKAAATYMAALVWQAVQTVVKAAAEGMDWLQEIAGLLSGEGKAVVWRTPTGFPVVNAYYKPKIERVELFLFDRALEIPKRVVPRVKVGDTNELLKRKQRSSISPNFVHSLDSAHLQKVVLKAKEEGITNFLLVHDSFGCLPSDMPRFVNIVKETFVDLYEKHDPLLSLYYETLETLSEKGRKKLKEPPAKGSFELGEVKESLYAFA
jgi:DNA-directed RNA polymerase, mitochondrial